MAVGDVVGDNQSITTGSRLDIQPGSGAEWTLRSVYWTADSVDLEWFDGTNALKFKTISTPGGDCILNVGAGLTNTNRWRVKNNDGTSKRIGYDAIVTK